MSIITDALGLFLRLRYLCVLREVGMQISLATNGIVIRLIFSYSARTYFPFPILLESSFLIFQAFIASTSDFLLSSGLSKFFIPSRCWENIVIPLRSHIVTSLIFGSKLVISL